MNECVLCYLPLSLFFNFYNHHSGDMYDPHFSPNINCLGRPGLTLLHCICDWVIVIDLKENTMIETDVVIFLAGASSLWSVSHKEKVGADNMLLHGGVKDRDEEDKL